MTTTQYDIPPLDIHWSDPDTATLNTLINLLNDKNNFNPELFTEHTLPILQTSLKPNSTFYPTQTKKNVYRNFSGSISWK